MKPYVKPILITLIVLVLLIPILLIIGIKLIGPSLISTAPPSGDPIGEYDVPREETTRMVLDLTIPLSALDAAANEKIPAVFEGSEKKDFHKSIRDGFIEWKIQRGDIQFANVGGQASFSVPFSGNAKLKGTLDAKIFALPIDGNAKVEGTFSGTLAPDIRPNWTVIPNLSPDLKLDQAVLSLPPVGNIDISSFLSGSLGQSLQSEIQKLAPSLKNGLDIRKKPAELWEKGHLAQTISDSPPLWIYTVPQRVLLSPLDFSAADSIRLKMAMEGRTSLHIRPPAAPDQTPLPDAEILPSDPEFNHCDLRLPVVISMTELNQILADTKFDLNAGAGTKVNIHGLSAEMGEGGFLNLRLNLEADKSALGRGVFGSIWVKGRPWIDLEKQTLGFGDVALTLETQDVLTSGAAWLLDGILVKGLESKLRVDLNDHREKIDQEVKKWISRAHLPEDVSVSLENLSVTVSDAYTVTRHAVGERDDPAIVVVIRATGDLGVRLNRLDFKK